MRKEEIELKGLERKFLEITHSTFGEDEGWYGTHTHCGIFGQALVMWMMTLQALETASLSEVLTLLREGAADEVLSRNAGSKKAAQRDISPSTGGYSQARSHLALETVEDVSEVITEALRREQGGKVPGVYLIDGTILTLQGTKDIEKVFSRGRNQHRAHLPQMRLVFATDVESQVATKPSFGAVSKSEQALAMKVIDELETKAHVIGDRNFGIFSVASRCARHGKYPIVRLTASRAQRLIGQALPSVPTEYQVTWKATRHDKLLDQDDPREVKGRLICTEIKVGDKPPFMLYLFTNSVLSNSEIVAMYGQRQCIETDIRYLKQTLEADFITAQTSDMVKKELLMRFVAYNLLTSVVAKAAQKVGLTARAIKFSQVVRYAKVYGKKISNVKKQNEKEKLYQEFLKIVRQSKKPNRKPRSEPRALRRNPRTYPLLKKARNAKIS